MPINNSTRKSRTSNSDTFMALQYPAYKRDIKERKEREQIEIKKEVSTKFSGSIIERR